MNTIQGRVLAFPETEDRSAILRVDLRYLLTPVTPYKRTYTTFRKDQFEHTDYGTMLAQQLRRCEGVGAVHITHYGCKAEVGSLYTTREMTREIRRATEITLQTQIPWTVHRPDHLNWGYQFGVPKPDTEAGTEFTQCLLREVVGSRGGLGSPWHHRYNLDARVDPTDWDILDPEYDGLVAKFAGTRELTIDWE